MLVSIWIMCTYIFFFFFQAEDGIRDRSSAFLLNRSSDLCHAQEQRNAAQNVYRSVEHDQKTGLTTFGQFHQHHSQMPRRSEERFSRNAETDLVCRLLLEKKKTRLSICPVLQLLAGSTTFL